jgi:hypothetical protein
MQYDMQLHRPNCLVCPLRIFILRWCGYYCALERFIALNQIISTPCPQVHLSASLATLDHIMVQQVSPNNIKLIKLHSINESKVHIDMQLHVDIFCCSFKHWFRFASKHELIWTFAWKFMCAKVCKL